MRTRLLRLRYNLFPAYRGTGGRVAYIAADFREVRVRIRLSWRTRNLVGSIFGGSIYGAVDPIYTTMLMKLLGRDYVVWDKAASIRFKRPGRTTLHARFAITDEELDAIRRGLEAAGKVDRHYQVEITDREGVVHAIIDKTVHVRRRGGAP